MKQITIESVMKTLKSENLVMLMGIAAALLTFKSCTIKFEVTENGEVDWNFIDAEDKDETNQSS